MARPLIKLNLLESYLATQFISRAGSRSRAEGEALYTPTVHSCGDGHRLTAYHAIQTMGPHTLWAVGQYTGSLSVGR